MYEALSAHPGKAWLVATGALTNVGLLFAVYPQLADKIAGLSIMGGAVGGFFTNAPLGRMNERVNLRKSVYKDFPGGLPGESEKTIEQIVQHFQELGILDGSENIDGEKTRLLLDQARRSFGNSTPYAEFNVSSAPFP
jgi:uridine nucleosidase